MNKSITLVPFFILILSFLWYGCETPKEFHKISEAFEIRYVSSDTAANGETDFKGPTAVFNTADRLEYLQKFSEYGKKFFNDPNLDKQVITDAEVDSALQTLKPQPKPKTRQEIHLDDWKYLGYKKGQRQDELKQITQWRQMKGTRVEDDALILDRNKISRSFAPKKWRMKFSWEVKPLQQRQHILFNFSDGAMVGFNKQGLFYYITDDKKVETKRRYKPDQPYNLKVEIDLESGKYNFYVNGDLVADFVPLSRQTEVISSMTIETDGKIMIDNIWAVGYKRGKRESRTHPYFINTFIDQDFSARSLPEGFENISYDDSGWATVPYRRYAHGGERNRGEKLYLRKIVNVGDFEQARLHIESVRPSGKLYINGTFVKELGRAPETFEVNKWLKSNQENLIALQINSYAVDNVRYHMSTDRWSSIFAGLMKLELTNNTYINDIYAFTTNIDDSAQVQLNVEATSDRQNGFSGTLITDFYPWHPQESKKSAAHATQKIQIMQGKSNTIKKNITIADPNLWTSKYPSLYKVHVKLKDEDGNIVDDYVTTTGLRTISQRGGIFRINDKPEVMYGPLVFNQPYPLERVSQWMFSPPKSTWVETILETKKMNGNAIRMAVHDKNIAGINDKRLARIGDQMGIMFMWQTPLWIRDANADKLFSFKDLPKYIKEVRNHPSIVIWQPGNHPTYSMDWFDKVYNTIYRADSSRFISPAARTNRMKGKFKNPKSSQNYPHDLDSTYPAWRASIVARGNMEVVTSYGKEWDILRKFPNEKFDKIPAKIRQSYLNSKTHAWFDFENEETIGMPNWNLNKGKPYHKIYSYEKNYNKGNIGRELKFSEWKESQAWQALSGYEAYRKKRWLDFDGLNWCNLRGGPNTATYMKPLIAYGGEAKSAYYAVKMAQQRTLAGSKNVDLVYGPDDEIPITVMHLGNSQNVNVQVVVKTLDGQVIARKNIDNVKLKSGRNVTDLESWKPDLEPDRYYAIEYTIKPK